MTVIYFVRHAEPNYNNHNDELRELTTKGLEDSRLVTNFLSDKAIRVVLSSPYTRSIDTIKDFADAYSHKIETVHDFRERKIANVWIDDFKAFSKQQWEDFDYKLADGESLREVQNRNINALNLVLNKHKDKNIVIGSHGTALSTIISHYDSSFGYESFEVIKSLMPWIVKVTFENDVLQGIEMFDVFTK
ncbi:histidine phosphatase family protein [Clostridium sp. 19966]|uniref:histidine phosphatase family protein n=1 Tax=Clostridium sp. 19966 TaxID=2768166 RepID=UPI0028DEE2AF|nr:histidine phosphatase family protein [Clostridium sp. 19966]MDT8718455.1 histidine phosphatase family protein [Clostridium sp. 19966]